MIKQPLHILISKFHPRVEYTFHVLFEILSDNEYKLVEVSPGMSLPEGVSFLNYSGMNFPGIPEIPNHGLLFTDEILNPGEWIFDPKKDNFPKRFISKSKNPEQLFDFDLPASLFTMIAMYDHYLPDSKGETDTHGRKSFLEQKQWLQEPVAHEYAALLCEKLQCVLPKINSVKKDFSWEITIDVDQPWKHKYKSIFVRAGGWLKSLLKFDRVALKERWGAVSGKKDPFDVYHTIQEICPREKTLFFFLVDHNSEFDSRYSLKNKHYRDLVVRIDKQFGFKTGLHPSYSSWLDGNRIKNEKESLVAISGPVIRTRQHYLRYQVPETFRLLEEAGLKHDYSICPFEQTGFLTGMAVSYPWFDVSQNRKSNLFLHPAQVMDRTLLQYLNQNPDEAWESIQAMIIKVKSVGGKFVIILHNETFSDSGEWKGWLKLIRKMVAFLKEKK